MIANLTYSIRTRLTRAGRPEELLQAHNQADFIPDLALPYHQRPPAGGRERIDSGQIAQLVGLELSHPKFHIGCRRRRLSAAFVVVPKASVHEDNGTARWKNQVRTARKVATPETEPVIHPMGEFEDHEFGHRPGLPDARHVARTGHLIEKIRHGLPHPSFEAEAGAFR